MSQSLGLSQGTLEERFAHILQPIRDLTKNWDVDIANYLEEYLEDLEKVQISLDDGVTTMNFSEAALLIQGSAGVYAKKVEYLYSLVFQVLDLVTQNKKKSSKRDGEAGEGEDNDDQPQDDGDGEFLVLDDNVVNCDGSYRKEVDTSQNKSVRVVPETPSRFVALQEAEKDDTALYNEKGDVVGNPCDFNIDMGYMTAGGSFLLEFGDRPLLALQSRQRMLMLGDLAEEHGCEHRGDSVADIQNGGDVLDEPEDHVFGLAAEEEADAACAAQLDPEVSEKQKEPPRRSTRKKVKFAAGSKPDKANRRDVPLDPYESSKTAEKPFVKKKPYVVPQSLTENKARKRKKKPVKKELKPIHEVVEALFSHRSKFPKKPLKVPEYPELDDAFWKEFKLREEDNKASIKKIKQLRASEGEANVEEEEGGEDEEDIPQGLDDLGKDDVDDVDDQPPLCLNDDLFGDRISAGPSRIPSDTGFQTISNEDVTVTYEDLVKMHVEKYLTSAAQYAQITDLSRRVADWEEKIKPRLEEEQEHPNFDIHKYGTDMLEQMVRGQAIPFRKLVKGMTEYQICRYTLAILQLANVYNVELSVVPDSTGSIIDRLHVTLLSTKRHFEQLEEYQAPSLEDK